MRSLIQPSITAKLIPKCRKYTTESVPPTQRLRRVLFNVPGSDLRKVKKATQLNLDCAVLDLEDGVAINQKENARNLVKEVLLSKEEYNFGRAERLIRMNSIDSKLEDEDLESCIKTIASEGMLDGIVVPKVESPEHLVKVSKYLDSCGSAAKNVKLLAAIESAKALVDLKEICRAETNRLEALIFASEDFCANIGMTRSSEAKEMLYARSAVVAHAVAFGLQSIDMVCLDFKNEEVLMKETTEGRMMGFTGKQAIHPNQVEPIYRAFRPSDKELDFARRIVEGNAKHQAEGKGAFTVDGKMIDMPMYKWALGILQRSQHS